MARSTHPASRLVAHRGFPGKYPENSLAGVEAALRAGCDWVEIDVQFTRDLVAVACHDDDLMRVGGRGDRVADLRWSELRRMSVAESDRFGEAFAETRPTTAEQVAELVGSYGCGLFFDVKRCGIETFGTKAVLTALRSALDRVADRGVVISADREILRGARDAGSAIGWILGGYGAPDREQASSLGPDYLFCNRKRVTDGPLWAGNWAWVVYVVDEPGEVREWWERGARLVETDCIGNLLEAMG